MQEIIRQNGLLKYTFEKIEMVRITKTDNTLNDRGVPKQSKQTLTVDAEVFSEFADKFNAAKDEDVSIPT